MRNKAKILKQLLAGSVALSSIIGCGSVGTGNDQGVSFTLYGMFQDSACANGLSGASVSLSTDPETNGSGTGVLASLGLQNNMAQGIRTRRVFLKYYVEGGEIQPPPTSQALGLFLGPGTKTINSSLPDGVTGGDNANGTNALSNVGCSEFELVPPEILAYLNLNRTSFPELPFKMRVEVSVSGIGTAGDEYTSNPIDVPIEVVQDNLIQPSPADDSGTTSTETSLATDDGTGSVGEVTEGNTEVIPVIPGTDQPAG
jgi:hypothetical protein